MREKKVERDEEREREDKHDGWRCSWGDSWLVGPPGDILENGGVIA